MTVQCGIIYRARSMNTGMYYIGQTTTTFNIRKNSHISHSRSKVQIQSKFSKALAEQGEQAFEWDILHYNVPLNALNEIERIEIAIHDSCQNGYNGDDGSSSSSPKCYEIPTHLFDDMYDLYVINLFSKVSTAQKLASKGVINKVIVEAFKSDEWLLYVEKRGLPCYTDLEKSIIKASRRYTIPMSMEIFDRYYHWIFLEKMSYKQIQYQIQRIHDVDISIERIKYFFQTNSIWKKYVNSRKSP